ncbi:7045_t:CDS:1, partial [Acaulospora colombiana]
ADNWVTSDQESLRHRLCTGSLAFFSSVLSMMYHHSVFSCHRSSEYLQVFIFGMSFPRSNPLYRARQIE